MLDLFWEQNKRCPNPTVTLHYFHWPTTRPDTHTKIALRLQSSSHSGDTNGMIDTNVSRANCAADLHRSDRASYLSTHLGCWQEPLWRGFFFFPGAHEWLLIRPSKMSLSSICCLDGMQIHHNILASVSSCSGSLNCGTKATESG